MNLRMNGIYLGLFQNVSLMGFWDFFFLTHIEDTKSVEFASVAICSTFFHKMTGLSSCHSLLQMKFHRRKLFDCWLMYNFRL